MRSSASAYIFLAKASVLNQLTYRVEAFASFGLNLLPLVTLVFLWRSTFSGSGEIAGVSQEQMIAYSIVSIALKDVFYFRTQDNLLAGVQSGSIVVDLIRPYNVLGRYLAEDVAASGIALFRRLLPLILFSGLFIAVPRPASFSAAILFLVSCLFSYWILWTLSALTGLVAFWAMEVGNLSMVKDALVRVLSGSIVPLWFFPEPAQKILDFLPFKYTYQTPLGIFVGRTGLLAGFYEVLIQGAWAAGLGLLVFAVWRSAQKRLVLQGG